MWGNNFRVTFVLSKEGQDHKWARGPSAPNCDVFPRSMMSILGVSGGSELGFGPLYIFRRRLSLRMRWSCRPDPSDPIETSKFGVATIAAERTSMVVQTRSREYPTDQTSGWPWTTPVVGIPEVELVSAHTKQKLLLNPHLARQANRKLRLNSVVGQRHRSRPIKKVLND